MGSFGSNARPCVLAVGSCETWELLQIKVLSPVLSVSFCDCGRVVGLCHWCAGSGSRVRPKDVQHGRLSLVPRSSVSRHTCSALLECQGRPDHSQTSRISSSCSGDSISGNEVGWA